MATWREREESQKSRNEATELNQSKVPHTIAKFTCAALLLVLPLAACTTQQTQSQPVTSLAEARRGFKTVLLPQKGAKEPVELAPPTLFKIVKYPTSSGKLSAYLSPNPRSGKRYPAIIWITGGDSNSISDVWSPGARDNDQTAAAFRKAGVVMMFPSLRGGNDNPGVKEGFLGEVDDVLAAAKYLEKQAYVDPKRIFLGGHSTGGTLALLVAESSDRFRAVFSFGPVDDVSGYGSDSGFLPFDISNLQEVKLRSPKYWLSSIQSPTWVFEGTNGNSNIDALRSMRQASTNSKAHFIEIKGADHFATLAPTNETIAKKILQDTGETSNISFSEDGASRAFQK